MLTLCRYSERASDFAHTESHRDTRRESGKKSHATFDEMGKGHAFFIIGKQYPLSYTANPLLLSSYCTQTLDLFSFDSKFYCNIFLFYRRTAQFYCYYLCHLSSICNWWLCSVNNNQKFAWFIFTEHCHCSLHAAAAPVRLGNVAEVSSVSCRVVSNQ